MIGGLTQGKVLLAAPRRRWQRATKRRLQALSILAGEHAADRLRHPGARRRYTGVGVMWEGAPLGLHMVVSRPRAESTEAFLWRAELVLDHPLVSGFERESKTGRLVLSFGLRPV